MHKLAAKRGQGCLSKVVVPACSSLAALPIGRGGLVQAAARQAVQTKVALVAGAASG